MRSRLWTGWDEVSVFEWLTDMSLLVALILCLVWLLVRIGGERISASKKHTLLAAGLLSVPLLMVASLWVPGWGWQPTSSGAGEGVIRARSSAPSEQMVFPSINHRIVESQNGNEGVIPVEDSSAGQWFLLVGWLGGILVFALLVLASAWRLRQMRLQATPIREGWRAEMMESVRGEFGISGKRNLTLLESGAHPMPMTWGWRNAVVLLPSESAEWDEGRLRLVLRHEIAHVVRADSAVSLSTFLCASLLWFHPLAWLTCRRLWQVREQACDDHVLNVCDTDAASYAEELLAVVRSLGTTRPSVPVPALAMAMSQSSGRNLRARVHSVLAEDRHRGGFGEKMRRVVLPIWLMSVVFLAGLSACREVVNKEAEAGLPDGWSRRIFILTDEQWQRLSGGEDLFLNTSNDPFSDPTTLSQTPTIENLRSAALAVRSRLINEGVEFEFRTPEDAAAGVSMDDSRTLVVSGDDALLGQVAGLLASYTHSPQIRIRAHVFRVSTDFAFQDDLEIVEDTSPAGSVTGVVDPETAKELLARVERAAGTEVIARPVVVTGSSVPATLEVIREFIYPTEYDPPEFPQQIAGDSKQRGTFSVTPATPTAFETRNVGLVMQIKPELHRDGAISLDLNLEQVNFEGFINYGSPIHAAMKDDETGETVPVVLSENRIEMPVFTSSRYDSEIITDPSDWIVIGGMGESRNYTAIDVEIDSATGKRRSDADNEAAQSILLFIIKVDLVE